MMEMVVNDDNGTGTLAFSNEIRIAGKTGTAQKYDKNKRAFSRERVVASFEGIMPADNPRLVMLVSLDEPKKDGWGGIAAAPVFQKITEEIMGRNILGMIPQSQVIHSEPLLREPHRKTKMTSRREKRDIIFDKERMPDFQEMSIREVLRIGEELGIVVVSNGSGWAYKQEPPAGAPLGNDAERVCKVYFRI
ncbi:MAG: PASTA domain-containing protein [Deltaproteobacteria bacterium]|nr:PASTA domain-containing protein [Deltaproteobacteria bacterium]